MRFHACLVPDFLPKLSRIRDTPLPEIVVILQFYAVFLADVSLEFEHGRFFGGRRPP